MVCRLARQLCSFPGVLREGHRSSWRGHSASIPSKWTQLADTCQGPGLVGDGKGSRVSSEMAELPVL